jgi:ketosteroid isomerase-like protein/heme exporter protein D
MQISAMSSFILTILMVQASSQGIAAETAQPDRSIVKTADAYLKAVLAGDAAAVGATYREDAVEMPPSRPPLKGHAAIEQYYRELFQGPVKITAFTFSHLEATSVGDLGYTFGTYKQKLSGGPSGSIDDTGKFVVIVKRTGTAWKAAYVIYNSDHPPANPAVVALPLPFPQRDLAALFSYYADQVSSWLVHIGWCALGVGSLALIALLVRAVRQRSAGLGSPKSRRLERLRSAQRNFASAIHGAAGASLHP